LGSRASLSAGLSSNLLRLPETRSHTPSVIFARTFQRYQKSALRSNPVRATPAQKSAQRKISNSNRRKTRLSRLRLTGVYSWVCNSLFCLSSEGIPTGGYQGRLPRLTQRTSITTCFPLPTTGQAHRPPGGSTSNLQLSKSSTHYPCMQATHQTCRCRFIATVQE
jgi:hypothetical protein